MRPKSVLILFAIVVALLAFIWFYERQLPSSDERGELAKKALRFERGEIDAIEIELEGERLRLTRVPADVASEEDEGSLGFFEDEWRLEEPLQARADAALVNGLLDALDALETARELEGMGSAEAGLDAPRASLVLSTDTGDQELVVGSEVPASETMIVRVDEGQPLVVSNALWESLSHPAGDWRSKDLYLGERDAIESVTLRSATATVQLVRKGDSFWLEEPVADRADEEKVSELLGSLVGLKVHEFIDDPEAPLADMGLDPVFATVEVGATGGSEVFQLEWGAPTSAEATRHFARLGDQVFETAGPFAEYLSSGPESWRSLALTTFETHQIDSIRVLDDQGELTLQRAGADWVRDDERISFTAVSDLLYALVEARAARVEGSGEIGGNRVASGDTDIEITLSDGERQEILSLEPLPEGGWAASSSEREAILVLDGAVSGEIGQKLRAVRAAEPLGTGDPGPATENLENSGDESQG